MRETVLKKILVVALTAVMTIMNVACGTVQEAVIDDQAGARGKDEGVGEFWIDDQAIAMAESAASSQDALDACQAVFVLVNQRRAAQGLAELAWSNALTSAAQVRANEITSSFSHTRPNGSAFWTVDSNVQYGENLAKLYQSAQAVFDAWMNSPTHAANIMAAEYKTIGIAICQTGDGKWYWAQEFGY